MKPLDTRPETTLPRKPPRKLPRKPLAEKTRAAIRAALIGCLVVVLAMFLTNPARAAAWRPIGRGAVSGRATVLPLPLVSLTPAPPAATCAGTALWSLRWTLKQSQPYLITFDVWRAGKLYPVGYIVENFSHGYYTYVAYVSKSSTGSTFTVTYSAKGWTATSAPVGCVKT